MIESSKTATTNGASRKTKNDFDAFLAAWRKSKRILYIEDVIARDYRRSLREEKKNPDKRGIRTPASCETRMLRVVIHSETQA
jgi:hypothetical protein